MYQCMAKNEVDRPALAKVRDPVPAMHTLDTHDDIANIGFEKLKEFFGVG